MKKKTTIIIGAIFVFFASITNAQPVEVNEIDIIDFGIYQADKKMKQAVDNLPTGGLNIIKDFNFIQTTDKIPLKKGIRFGYKYIIRGKPKEAIVTLRFKDSYPGLKDPRRSELMYHGEYNSNEKMGIQLVNGYMLEEDWELVPGEWTFAIWHNGKKLAEKTFILYKP